jgi:opacity protein-like surface antigen
MRIQRHWISMTGGKESMMRTTVVVTLVLLTVLALTSGTHAQSDIGFYGFGARVGFVLPEDPIESTFGLGVHADLGTIAENVRLGAVTEYWGKSYEAVADFHHGADWSWSVISIAATVKYMFPTPSTLRPYVGGEVGLAIGRWDWDYRAPSFHLKDSGSDTDIGFGALGGVEFPLSSSVKGVVEAKYHINGVDYLGIFGGITLLLTS